MTLEEAIKHCVDVSKEKTSFECYKKNCEYISVGFEDGYVTICRNPNNIPVGASWGDCKETVCPNFISCKECGNEHKQLAEWLCELSILRERFQFLIGSIKTSTNQWHVYYQYCSNCIEEVPFKEYPQYCSNCGCLFTNGGKFYKLFEEEE